MTAFTAPFTDEKRLDSDEMSPQCLGLKHPRAHRKGDASPLNGGHAVMLDEVLVRFIALPMEFDGMLGPVHA